MVETGAGPADTADRTTPLYQARGVTRSFGRVVALRGADFSVSSGEGAVARATAWGRRVVIMDEPTAALGVRESAMVLRLIERVKAAGIAVIMISHSMPEVFEVADRITILRLGRTVRQMRRSETSMTDVVAFMTGAAVEQVASME